MAFNIHSYTTMLPTSKARLVIYPCASLAHTALTIHKKGGEKAVCVSTFIHEGSATLPMPNELFETFDEWIQVQKAPVVVTGLDAYISLLATPEQERAISSMRKRIDKNKRPFTFLLRSCPNINAIFNKPGYTEGCQLVELTDNSSHDEEISSPEVTLYPLAWEPNTTDVRSDRKSVV